LIYAVRAAFNGGTDVGHVFQSTDGGMTWRNISGNLTDLPTWSIVVDTRPGLQRIYVGTDNGGFSSPDARATSSPDKTGLPDAQVVSLALDPTTNILAAGTRGRGMYEIQVTQTISVQMIDPGSLSAGRFLNDIPIAQFTDLIAPGPVTNYNATINWG